MTTDRHIIFGTAGHVDHGKSSLVLALTGSDPDRLAEEKAREMTIDLGFAFLPLPGLADRAAIVDVPGHEMFIRNMVAGVTGIDAVIFVVAADEGIQPQTVEHLEIVRVLGIASGVIALTKCDKVSADELSLRAGEVRELVKGTTLEGAKILPVSSVTRAGLPALVEELARLAANVVARSAGGIFRLPIDRVFTLKGAGTVITGTVISGSIRQGDDLVALPAGLSLRIRGLQVHGEPAERICAGQRAAVNLADVSKEQLTRGDVLTTPGSMAATTMMDARLRLSARAPRPLQQRARVRLHHQTREVMARVVLLEQEQLEPGESALVQLRLETPLVVLAGDPFVMRSYSPMFVIGGGTILDAHPPKRRKTAGADELARRETEPADEAVAEALERAAARGISFDDLRVRCSIAADELARTLDELSRDGRAFRGKQNLWYAAGAVEELQEGITSALAKLHAREPLRAFAALNAVAAAAAPAPESRECFRIALERLRAQGKVAASGDKLALASHKPQWVGRFAAARDRIMQELEKSGIGPPPAQELAALAGITPEECKRILDALAEAGQLLALPDGICLLPAAYARARAQVSEFLARNRSMTIAQARDLLGVSRKYLLPFLESLDREGVTVRQRDARTARTSNTQ